MSVIRPLVAELGAIAKEELNEVSSRIPSDVQALKDWLSKQPHIKARLGKCCLWGSVYQYLFRRLKDKLPTCMPAPHIPK